jgi:hypothetical protein
MAHWLHLRGAGIEEVRPSLVSVALPCITFFAVTLKQSYSRLDRDIEARILKALHSLLQWPHCQDRYLQFTAIVLLLLLLLLDAVIFRNVHAHSYLSILVDPWKRLLPRRVGLRLFNLAFPLPPPDRWVSSEASETIVPGLVLLRRSRPCTWRRGGLEEPEVKHLPELATISLE